MKLMFSKAEEVCDLEGIADGFLKKVQRTDRVASACSVRLLELGGVRAGSVCVTAVYLLGTGCPESA